MPSRKIKRFSFAMKEEYLMDMKFLCELRDFVRGTDWDSVLALSLVENAIDEVERKLMHRIGEDLYYKRLDHENHKKIQAKLRKK